MNIKLDKNGHTVHGNAEEIQMLSTALPRWRAVMVVGAYFIVFLLAVEAVGQTSSPASIATGAGQPVAAQAAPVPESSGAQGTAGAKAR